MIPVQSPASDPVRRRLGIITRLFLAGAYLADAYSRAPGTFPLVSRQSEQSEARERYAERAARFRERNPHVPVVECLDAKLLAILESGSGSLKMDSWHTCETTHCRAGWAVRLAGKAGNALEAQFGPQHAGAMIYRASTGRVPHFYASNERALEDIREQAAPVAELTQDSGRPTSAKPQSTR